MLINEICRFCFEEENSDNIFLAPCLCNGTSKYVHEKCLRKWRYNSINRKAYHECMVCKTKYKTINEYPFEKYKINFFNIEERQKIVAEYFILNGIILLISTIMYFKNIQLNIFNDKYLKSLLKRDDIIFFFYNYSFASYIISLLINIYFYKNVFFNVKRLESYIHTSGLELGLYFIASNHFIWFYLIIGLAADSYYIYVYIESVVSLINFVYYMLLCDLHNSTLNTLNHKLNKSTVMNYTNENIDI